MFGHPFITGLLYQITRICLFIYTHSMFVIHEGIRHHKWINPSKISGRKSIKTGAYLRIKTS